MYKTNDEYLKAIMAAMDRWNDLASKGKKKLFPDTEDLEKNVPSEIPVETQSEEVRKLFFEILAEGAKAANNGVKIGLEIMASTYKLSEIEKLLACYLLWREVDKGILFGTNTTSVGFLSRLYNKNIVEILASIAEGPDLLRKGSVFQVSNHFDFPDNLSLKERPRYILLTGRLNPPKPRKQKLHVMLPDEIYRKLSDTVVGQDTAIRALSAIAYQHMIRGQSGGKHTGPKLNTMLIGPTGCGKTHMVRSLAKIIDVPVAFCDASQHTKTGYVGKDVEDMLLSLYRAAGNDYERMARGIIFIDEVDKIAAKACWFKDVSGEDVQHELLRILEGEYVNYEIRSNPFRPVEYNFKVDGILFILAGAFSRMDKIIANRQKKSSRIGFSRNPESAGDSRQCNPTIKDLTDYGMVPELLGRVPNVIAINKLSIENFEAILRNENISLLNYYQNFMRQRGVSLKIPDEFITRVAVMAKERGLGARGLNAFLETSLTSLVFEMAGKKKQNMEDTELNISDYVDTAIFEGLMAQ